MAVGLDRAGHDTEVAEAADVGVGGGLEDKDGGRSAVAHFEALPVGIDHLALGGGGGDGDERVEHLAHADLVGRGGAENGHDVAGGKGRAEGAV